MSTYSELLRDPRWQRKRLEVMDRDGWRCRHCGDGGRNLQVHHKRYDRDKAPWEYDGQHLVTLCEGCHETTTKAHRRLKDVAAEMTTHDLVAFVTTMARPAGGDPTRKPLQGALEDLERERTQLLGQPYTKEASRRLEALDELTDRIWGVLEAGAKA